MNIKIIKNNLSKYHKDMIYKYTKELNIFSHKEFKHEFKFMKNKKYRYLNDKSAYLIMLDGKIVGIFSLSYVKKDDLYYLWRFYIDEKYRYMGIGSKVLDFIDKCMLNNKNSYIRLGVEEGNTKAMNFYLNRGFNIEFEEVIWEHYYLYKNVAR